MGQRCSEAPKPLSPLSRSIQLPEGAIQTYDSTRESMRLSFMQTLKSSISLACLGLSLSCSPMLLAAESAEAGQVSGDPSDLPKYEEIVDIIQSRLPDISAEDLEQAALQGILTEFQSVIELALPPASENEDAAPEATIAKQEIMAGGMAYIRMHKISTGAAAQLFEAIESLKVDTKLKGLVLDLRYADGSDYAAVLELAGLFVSTPVDLMDWGNGLKQTIPHATGLQLPLAILINEATKGAAEVLAAGLKQLKVGAVIGRPTSGQALKRERVPLSSGHHLSIALGAVTLADGTALSGSGIQPDIDVEVTPEEQAAWFDDPYGRVKGNAGATQRENRVNEAALMKRQKEGRGAEMEINVPPPSEPESTQAANQAIMDPILARGIDLLKGWSIFSQLKQ